MKWGQGLIKQNDGEDLFDEVTFEQSPSQVIILDKMGGRDEEGNPS